MQSQRRTLQFLLTLAFSSTLLEACAHRLRFTPRESDRLFIRRVIRMEGVDVIDNLNQWSLKADVKNLYPGPTLFYMSEVRCFKGEVEGELDIAYYPENIMHLKRGQVRKLAFRCLFPARHENSGDYKLLIPRLFHNPLDDGETTDQVVAKDVLWKIKPSQNI